MVNRPSDYMDNFWGMQHAYLDGVNANVVHHRLNLGFEELGWYAVNTLNTYRILCSQRCDGSHAVTAKGRKSFQVGLYACTASAVRSCNCQNAWVMLQRGGLLGIHSLNYAQRFENSLQGFEKL
jgi:hypothetical protein